MSFTLIFLIYLLCINVFTTLVFWFDKNRARAKQRRVPERKLLFLALIGGSPGAFWAREFFRHKTRKQPFSNYLKSIVLLQAIIVLMLILFKDQLLFQIYLLTVQPVPMPL